MTHALVEATTRLLSLSAELLQEMRAEELTVACIKRTREASVESFDVLAAHPVSPRRPAAAPRRKISE